MDYKEKLKSKAKQKLEDVANARNLRIVKFYDDEYTDRFVRAHVIDSNNMSYFLKVLIDNHELLLARRLRAEVNFYEYAAECPVSQHLNELIDYGIDEHPIWYLREQLPGIAAGDFAHDFGFSKAVYDELNVEEITSFLRNKWYMGERNKMRDSLPLSRDNRIVEYMEWWYDKNRVYLSDDMVTYLLDFIRENAEAYKFSYWVLNHNDLWPNNIIIGSNRMVIIDWETVGFGFPLFDVGLLIANAWGNQSWYSSLAQQALSTLSEFSYEAIGVHNKQWNKVYLKMGYLYWCITLLMQADMHRGWLESQGQKKHPRWKMLVSMINRQIDVILSL